MRKFILVFLLLTSSILARDLLAIASNNALSDSSSKRLSDSELSEVVGGLNTAYDSNIYLYKHNTYHTLSHKWIVYLSPEEKMSGMLYLTGKEDVAKAVDNYKTFLNRTSIGTATIFISYDSRYLSPKVSLGVVDGSGRTWYMADSFAKSIINAWSASGHLKTTVANFKLMEARYGLRSPLRWL